MHFIYGSLLPTPSQPLAADSHRQHDVEMRGGQYRRVLLSLFRRLKRAAIGGIEARLCAAARPEASSPITPLQWLPAIRDACPAYQTWVPRGSIIPVTLSATSL